MENTVLESQNVKEDQEDDLQRKVEQLEERIKQIQEEFNGQRAKMKELFLQKEEELRRRQEENICLEDENTELKKKLDEAKSQLLAVGLKTEEDLLVEKRKAQEEIASLEHVLNETVKENSSCRMELDAEVRKLKEVIFKLQEENATLRVQIPREINDGPQISLSTVTKTLARKVVSQLGADTLSLGPDNIDESKRKAQEDEELRSLVTPLEEEIKALKEKLRSTDDELQKYKEQPMPKRLQDPGSSEITCDMCTNYEAQLVKIQTMAKDLEKKLAESERSLQAQKDDLSKEVQFRKEMEEKWNEKKEEYKIKLAELDGLSQRSHQSLMDLKQTYAQTEEGIKNQLQRLIIEREEVKKHLHELQRRNEYLTGKYNKNSQKLQNENINMPNDVEELHVSLLKAREELIIATIAQEVAQENVETLQCKIDMLTEQMEQIDTAKEQQIANLTRDIVHIKSQLEVYEKERSQYIEREEKLQRLEKQLEEMLKEKRKTDSTIAELRQRVTNLQQDLDTSEEVQKDFVRLSQTLQIQLEKIRESGSEVRWQHEEDVDECQNCRASFIVGKKNVKLHCRHCGHIFCQSCLSNVVNSGPKQRPSRVCDVCHTLLVRETAPYFSQDPPHTPD